MTQSIVTRELTVEVLCFEDIDCDRKTNCGGSYCDDIDGDKGTNCGGSSTVTRELTVDVLCFEDIDCESRTPGSLIVFFIILVSKRKQTGCYENYGIGPANRLC